MPVIRSNNSIRGRYAITVLLVLALLFLCSCSLFRTEPTPSPTPDVMDAFAPVSTPLVTPDVTYAKNPVQRFYEEYLHACNAPMAQLSSALTCNASVDSIDGLMRLSAHQSYVTKALVSVGRISSDGSSFYDTVYDAATGYGTIDGSSGAYSYSFDYDNSDEFLTGTLNGSVLSFDIVVSPTDVDSEDVSVSVLASVSVSSNEDRWISIVETDSVRTVLFLDDRMRFAVITDTFSELETPDHIISPTDVRTQWDILTVNADKVYSYSPDDPVVPDDLEGSDE